MGGGDQKENRKKAGFETGWWRAHRLNSPLQLCGTPSRDSKKPASMWATPSWDIKKLHGLVPKLKLMNATCQSPHDVSVPLHQPLLWNVELPLQADSGMTTERGPPHPPLLEHVLKGLSPTLRVCLACLPPSLAPQENAAFIKKNKTKNAPFHLCKVFREQPFQSSQGETLLSGPHDQL